MIAPNDGGPAFPAGEMYQGMTLRDYFAAKALCILSHLAFNETAAEGSPVPCSAVSALAYKLADAMLEARDKQEAKP